MITLSQVNQYALDNNLGDDTDVFSILSQMQLEFRNTTIQWVVDKVSPTPPAPKTSSFDMIEYSTQDVLDLFST